MKYLRKIFTTIALMTIFSVSVFAKSGFEFHYNALLGVGVGFPSKSFKDVGFKSDIGFDGTGLFQIGYMRQVKEGFGISYLLELGYNFSSYTISGKPDFNPIINDIFGLGNIIGNIFPNDMSVALDFTFYNIQVGLFPKFNFGNFSIGIGGGVKIPLIGGKETVTIGKEKESVKLSRSDIKNILEPDLIGYIKGTLDYSIFLTDRFALNLGLYLGYDIINAKILIGDRKDKFESFDFGAQIGLRFAPSR